MTISSTELKEAEDVGWWLDPANSGARKELAQRRPELELWLGMVEQKVARAFDDKKVSESNGRRIEFGVNR